MIEGVYVKELVTHADERGYFREIIRTSDSFFAAGFGQLSHSLVFPGVIKAWHGHRRQSQWTYVAAGDLHVVLYDSRPGSPTYGAQMELFVGEHHAARVYVMPPGVVHGYRCLSGPAHVIYVTSGTYEPNEEVRLRHDDASVGYDWTPARDIR